MSSLSPVSIIYSSDGYEVPAQNTIAIPTGTRGILSMGSDGTNARFLSVDSTGKLNVNATNLAIGTIGSTAPTSAELIGGTDGTNLRAASALNTSPSGSEYGLVVRNIPSGTQTISGTVTANAGSGTFNVTGTGSAGSPAAGVITIQGITSGTAVTVTGTIALTKSSTATLSSVSGSASSTSLLASNASRLGATFFNDSSAILWLKLGTTASTTSFTVRLMPNDFWEIPGTYIYTGAIDGIWALSTGAVRITELT